MQASLDSAHRVHLPERSPRWPASCYSADWEEPVVMMDPAAEVPTGYAERTVELVWRKARYVRNKNPEVWRADADDNLIHRWYYGVNDSSIGWVIDDTDRDDLKPRRVAGDGSGPRP